MKYIALICLFISVAAIKLSAQNMNQGSTTQSAFYQEIPYKQINGKIIIAVTIGGQQHNYLLDTGAPCQISDQTATQLNITASTTASMVDANGNKGNAKAAIVPSIKIGGIEFTNIPTLIFVPGFLQCFGIDGVIGSNLLRNAIISFNSTKKTIILTNDSTKLNLNNQHSIALDVKADDQSNPYLNVGFGNGTNNIFEFDSGDSGFLALSNQYMADLKKHDTFQIMSKGYGANSFGESGAENNNVKYRLKFKNLQIAGATFTSVITETQLNNAGTGNRIGVRLLDYGTLTLDYLHGKLYFDPFNPQTDLDEKTWPLSPMLNDNKLVTGIIWEKLKNTLKPGIQITAIDGVSYETIDLCNMVIQKNILQGKEHVTLTLKDKKGKISTLELVKE